MATFVIAAVAATVLSTPAVSMPSELGSAHLAQAHQWPEIASTREITLRAQSD
jgi:hypothetical protein